MSTAGHLHHQPGMSLGTPQLDICLGGLDNAALQAVRASKSIGCGRGLQTVLDQGRRVGQQRSAPCMGVICMYHPRHVVIELPFLPLAQKADRLCRNSKVLASVRWDMHKHGASCYSMPCSASFCTSPQMAAAVSRCDASVPGSQPNCVM
jgi:hypothetical protein